MNLGLAPTQEVVDPDPEGDTHLCLKCRETVTGLDNYIQHRRVECRGWARSAAGAERDVGAGRTDRSLETQTNDLKADDFFSLLELQSSAKPLAERPQAVAAAVAAAPPLRGMLTRSKSSGGRRQTTAHATRSPRGSRGPRTRGARGARDSDRPRNPEGSGTRSTSGARRSKRRGALKSTTRKRFPISAPYIATAPVEEDLVDRYPVFEDPDSPQPVEVTDDKVMPSSPVSTDEEGSALLAPPLRTSKAHGKIWRSSVWSRTPSPSPPPSPPPQSGGKWVPESPTWRTPIVNDDLSMKFEGIIEDMVDVDGLERGGDSGNAVAAEQLGKGSRETRQTEKRAYSHETESSQDSDMPSGGKWRPKLSLGDELRLIEDMMLESEDETAAPSEAARPRGSDDPRNGNEEPDENAPPPGHTRGKWAPGMQEKVRAGILGATTMRKSGSEVQYWCGVCNRRLSCRKMYERHLESRMHKTRMLPEIQLDMNTASRGAIEDEEKLMAKRVEAPAAAVGVGRRLGGKLWEAERCAVCRARVRRGQVGKHLVSHYHWRYARMLRDPLGQLGGSAASMVLSNIKLVAYESAFRCTLCKFYCNSSAALRQHWASDAHRAADMRVRDSPGQYWCTGCRVSCPTSAAMEVHLWSPAHKDVEEIINHSMPIVVLRFIPVLCLAPGCSAEFRYNRQLIRHERRCGHAVQGPGAGATSTASDRYQRKLWCPECGDLTRSRLGLQRHLLRKHPNTVEESFRSPYFCGWCSLEFTSAQEAAEHRLRQEHRDRRRGRERARRCPHCGESCAGLANLRIHLKTQHADQEHECSLCSERFALPQQVSRHYKEVHKQAENVVIPEARERMEALARSILSPRSPGPPHMCRLCAFATDSKAQILFHSVQHFPPEQRTGRAPRYRCPAPKCGKVFPKPALRAHLMTHSGERPYCCRFCDKTFRRKDTCVAHEVCTHGRRNDRTDAEGVDDPGAGPILVKPNNKMKKREKKKKNTPEEVTRKRLETTEPRERPFVCDTCGKGFFQKYTLRQHFMALHGVKPMACDAPGCAFRARSAAELRMHSFSHTSVRTEACAECPFIAKTKRQLVRHMMIHSGKKAYKCEFCDFATRISSHLSRHRRVHTGAKPYRCPHCSYCCNNLENLRKHVLQTGKHPGKSMYECRFCSSDSERFTSNFATEFKYHLIGTHSDRFRSVASATSFITGIYDREADEREVISSKRRNKTEMLVKTVATGKDPDPRSKSLSSEEDLPTSMLPRHSLETLEGEFYSMVGPEPAQDVIFIVEDDNFIVLKD